MTLMETAQLLGNFGEFFGAIAVVATLGYLTLQVRQNTLAMQSTAEVEAARQNIRAALETTTNGTPMASPASERNAHPAGREESRTALRLRCTPAAKPP